MPVDYSKWARILQAEAGDSGALGEEEEEKDWCEMRPEEREAACRRAQGEEEKLLRRRQEHERYVQSIQEDAQNEDSSWLYDVDPNSYADFTIKRIWRVVKPRGAKYFKAGDLDAAEQQWLGALELVQRVGLQWPTARELRGQLKSNLAQLYIQTQRWGEARAAASAALEADPRNEKALYRRALVRIHHAEWDEARLDLESLLAICPESAEARTRLAAVEDACRRQHTAFRRGAAAGLELSSAIEDLTPDGTLRKLCVLQPGLEQLEGEARRWAWPWGRAEWLGDSREKAVLTVHVVVRTMGGQELFSTRERMVLPETPQEQHELRLQMQEVAELDDLAGKAARTPADFCPREALRPMRWRYGDPCVYAGLDQAARSLRLGERALFEIDQPLLEPSVSQFYEKDGGVARVAGLPNFRHHIEERKLKLLAEELPEWELDLESKTQRTVRADLHLLSLDLYKDLSQGRSGEYLVRIADTGRGGRRLKPGMRVQGDFVVAGALDGKAIYRVEQAVWILGQEGREAYVNRHGERAVHIPACIGQILKDATWALLYEGARLEARMQHGPSPMELNPKLAKDLHWKRAWNHRPPVAITIDVTCVMVD